MLLGNCKNAVEKVILTLLRLEASFLIVCNLPHPRVNKTKQHTLID